MDFLRLIRYQNLLMLAFMQLLFRYGFLEFQAIPLALNHWEFALLVLSTVCIAAGGYIINNVFDIGTDHINKPAQVIVNSRISEATAYNYYVAFNVIGVGIGFYLSNVIGSPNFAILFVAIAATLYLYASTFKKYLLVGNIIVAVLLSLSVLIVGIFVLYPNITGDNRATMGTIFQVLIDYAIFAFMINFIREIVKDLEDVNGDYNQGMQTLPIVLGVSRTVNIVFVLSLIPIGLLLYYIYTYLFNLVYATVFGLILIVAPMIYFTIKIHGASTKKTFAHLSAVLKWIMLFGILSILVISLNILHNA
ncbi:MAG: geranylgeranylglycerol-phosphate geranylgeranyltransferase [Flavobacterium sp.]|nr:geranylgeranylglycerol-phosphate geranylgeranyltransferase [Flavobacterium sp.]